MYTSGTTARPKGCLLTHEARHPAGREGRAHPVRARPPGRASGTRCRCSTAAASSRCSGCFSRRRQVLPRRLLRARPRRCARSRTSAARCSTRRSRRSGCAVLDHPDFADDRPQRGAADAEHRAPRAAGAVRASACRGPRQVSLLRLDRVRHATSRCRLPTTRYEIRMQHARPAGGRDGDADRRPRDRRADRPAGAMGELLLPRLLQLRGLLQGPGGDGCGLRRRGLVPLRRPGQRRRGRQAWSTAAGSRTCSRWAARTSPRSRSRATWSATRRSRSRRSSALPTPATARCPPRSSSWRRAPTLTEAGAASTFCLGSIATFKVPRYVRFVTEWPMSGTKVQKFVLQRRLTAELEQAGITEAPRMSTRTRSVPDAALVGGAGSIG